MTIYLNEYKFPRCINCKTEMSPMDEDNFSTDDWFICETCLFVCAPSHYICESSEAHSIWEYMVPVFKSFTVQKLVVKGCFKWYYIPENPEKYICTCGADCQPKKMVPSEAPFKPITLKK